MRWPLRIRRGLAGAHATDEQLILLNDGELTGAEAAIVREHLSSCWQCRSRASGFEQVIGVLAAEHSAGTERAAEHFTTTWPMLRLRLRQSVAAGSRSAVTRWRTWAVAATVTVALVATLLFRLSSLRSVSAAELVRRTVAAEQLRVTGVQDPVVHVRLAVHVNGGPSRELDIWQDHTTGRIRRDGDREVAARVDRVMAANGMAGRRPLSIDAFMAWRDTARGEESVATVTLPSGEAGYELKVRSAQPAAEDHVAAVTTVIRSSDLHPVRQTLFLEEPTGAGTVDLTETAFELLAASRLPRDLFEGSLPAPADRPDTALRTVGEGDAATTDTAVVETTLVQALYVLHRSGACNEQITVKQAPTGRVRVSGVVDSTARREQLVTALAQVAGLAVDLRTPADDPTPDGTHRSAVVMAESQGQRSARPPLDLLWPNADPASLLRTSTAAVRESSLCLREAWALRRLALSIGTGDQGRLPMATRWLVEQMVRDHAGALRGSNHRLRTLLETAAPADDRLSDVTFAPRAAWQDQTAALLAACERVDNAVRALVSPPAEPVAEAESYLAAVRSANEAAVRALDQLERVVTASSAPTNGSREVR